MMDEMEKEINKSVDEISQHAESVKNSTSLTSRPTSEGVFKEEGTLGRYQDVLKNLRRARDKKEGDIRGIDSEINTLMEKKRKAYEEYRLIEAKEAATRAAIRTLEDHGVN